MTKKLFLILVTCVLLTPPAWAEWDLDVQGAAAVDFDDNIDNAASGEEGDIITRLRVGLGATYEERLQTFDIRANVTQSLFFDNDDRNNTAEDLSLTYDRELSRYDRLSFSNRFDHREIIEDFEDTLGTTSGRYQYYRNRARLEYERDLNPRADLRTYYSNESYSVSRGDLTDSLQHEIGVEADWQKDAANTLVAAYRFISRHYDPGDNIFLHVVTARWEHYFNPHLSVNSRTGLALADFDAGDDTVNPEAAVGLKYEFDQTGYASVRLANTSRANQSSNDVFESWRLTASVVRQLLARLRASVSLFYGEGEFENSSTRDEVAGFNSRLSYDVSEYVRVSAGYNLTRKTSNVASREYDKNLFTLAVEFVF